MTGQADVAQLQLAAKNLKLSGRERRLTLAPLGLALLTVDDGFRG
jgi:hypothetical protein